MKVKSRPSWDEYFMEMAHLVAKRSTCLRRQVGAVLIKDKKILATGYNGAPSGLEHCLDIGCLREKLGIPSGQRHELCLPGDEEVFTNDGYVPIKQIKIGQKVLTHKGVYRPVTKIFNRKYKGELCFIEPWYLLPVALTPEHPVLAIKTVQCQHDARTLCRETCKSVNNLHCDKHYLNYKLEWLPAKELSKKDIVLLPFEGRSNSADGLDFSFVEDTPSEYSRVLEARRKGKTYGEIQRELKVWNSTAYNWVEGGVPRGNIAIYDGELRHGSSPSKTIPVKIKLTKEVLRVIGFYLAEGCSSSNQVSFSFHRKEREFTDEIKSTMKKVFDLDCYEYKKQNSHTLVYSSIILAKAFKTLFGENCYKKRLPRFLTMLPDGEQKHIITAYRQGDGYRIDQYTETITTASKYLALQMVQILLRLGHIPVIDSGRNTYRVIWKDKFKISYAYIKDNTLFTPIRKISKTQYSGQVYNLEVEKDNSYVTKSFVVHNCRALHAEQNAIIQAAEHGTPLKDSVLYLTNQPCIICAKMIINAGIKEVIIAGDYPDEMARDFLKQAKVEVRKINKK